MNLPKVIYVMGPPGAGKGTQAELLAQKINYHRFSTGDAFRHVAALPTDLGRTVKETIDNGYLAPPALAAEIVIEAVKERLASGRGLIFDGTPRTVEEAALVDAFFKEQNYGRPLVIMLDVNQAEMARRNAERRFCLGIQGGFAVTNEHDVARCATLGGTVGARPDDDPKKFNVRWREFKERTWPVIAAYNKQGVAHVIDGQRPIPDVHQAIMAVVKSYS